MADLFETSLFLAHKLNECSNIHFVYLKKSIC